MTLAPHHATLVIMAKKKTTVPVRIKKTILDGLRKTAKKNDVSIRSIVEKAIVASQTK